MLFKRLSLLILLVILSGCTTRSYSTSCNNHDLPDMPLADEKVATELEHVCDDTKCANLNNWLNELYLFRQQYLVYKAN